MFRNRPVYSPPDETGAATTTEQASASAGSDPSQTSADPGTDLGAEDKTEEQKAAEASAAAAAADPAGATDLGGDDPADDPNKDKPWAEFHGAPVDDKGQPTDYTDLVAPDGMPMDEELLKEAVPVARELNLSGKGMQKIVDLKAKDIKVQTRRWNEHLADSKKEAMADPEIGGANYPKAVAAGKALIAKFGDAELKKDLNTYGLGARRSMIKFLNKIATAVGETTLAPSGGAGAGAVKEEKLHDILYRDTPGQQTR